MLVGLHSTCKLITRNTPPLSLFSHSYFCSNPLFPEKKQNFNTKCKTRTPRSYSTKSLNITNSLLYHNWHSFSQRNNFLSPFFSRSFCSNNTTISEDKINEALSALEIEIKELNATLRKIESELQTVTDPGEKQYLRNKEQSLRNKEQSLRDEKLLLRNKEQSLRDEKHILKKTLISEKVSLESTEKIISVFEKIEELTDGKFKLKDDFFCYSNLNTNPFPFSGREESINQVISNIEKRNSEHWKKVDRRFQFPVISVHGSPGSGKTRFIDEIAPRIMNHFKNKFVVISVSFNGRTEFTFSTDPGTNLAIRVLFEAFIAKSEGNLFEEFCSFFDKTKDISLFSVINAFCYFMEIKNNIEDFQIMLCIDEVVRSGNGDSTLATATAVMDAFRKPSDPKGMTRFFVLASTLDSMKSFTKNSGREIHWIKLPSLTEEESLKMMGTEITKKVIKNELMRYLVRDSGGHPRTVQAVADAITDDALKMVFDYNTAVRIVSARMNTFGLRFTTDILSLSDVLLGNAVSPSDRVPGSEETYDQKIASGQFYNSLNFNNGVFIPQVPILQLYTWTLNLENIVSRQYFANLLNYMLFITFHANTLDNSGEVSLKSMIGDKLEIWHACWEVMSRRLIYITKSDYSNKTHNINQWRMNLRSTNAEIFKGLTVVNTFDAFLHNLHKEWTRSLWEEPLTNSGNPLRPINEILKRVEFVSIILLPKNSNLPGFDIAVFDRNVNYELCVTLIQTKYSLNVKGFQLSELNNALMTVYANWLPFVDKQYPDKFLKATEDLGILTDRIIPTKTNGIDHDTFFGERIKPWNIKFIFLTMKEYTGSDQISSYIGNMKDGLMILTRDQLKELYGPTLFSRVCPGDQKYSKGIINKFDEVVEISKET